MAFSIKMILQIYLVCFSIFYVIDANPIIGVCIRNCAQCKKMFTSNFDGQLCADACIKFKGKIIPDCTDINAIAPFINRELIGGGGLIHLGFTRLFSQSVGRWTNKPVSQPLDDLYHFFEKSDSR